MKTEIRRVLNCRIVGRKMRHPSRLCENERGQTIKAESAMTVGNESVAGKAGTWIHMLSQTPHSIKAETPQVMLLTLLK